MMVIVMRALLILALLSILQPVFAESWFQVEVVVFEYTRPDTDGESWYGNPGLPGYQNSIDLVTAPARRRKTDGDSDAADNADGGDADIYRTPYLALSGETHNLEGVYRVLKLSSDYRPLFHASWQQPGRDEQQARYVHFKAVRGDGGERPLTEADMAGEDPQRTAGREQSQLIRTEEMAFDAMLRLRSTRFLHLDVDAAYFPVDPAVLQAGGAAGDIPAYRFADYVRLQESRRIHLKELHYFDHPLFGLIVQVTRIKDGKKSEE